MKRGLILQILDLTDSYSTNGATKVPIQVAELLLVFDAVFAIPVGLTPIRGYEHHINLKERA